jgi:asparagine synthase (glutamine-hydrolysing)
MCGIAGILYFDDQTKVDQGAVQKMTDAMSHRGPNADGYFCENNIGLGHRRLSIIDLSDSANQPFADATGRFQLIFNGELFNFLSVKPTIKGHLFKTTGDTEVLVEAFARAGIASLDPIKGMFAFAIWDRQCKELFLVRDRMGVKPLYYYIDQEKIIFASEIRGILATGLVKRKINQNSLAGFLKYQSVSSPDTIIDGIRELPAGSYMRVMGGKHEIRKYWELTAYQPVEDDENTVKRKVCSLLSDAVEQRLISDVPIGAFLSGGIDSSAVVGLMSKVSSKRPVTFNVGFNEQEYDESGFAELIAKKFDTDHQSIVMRPTIMLEELKHALDAMDTPSGDGINTYVVSKTVKNAGLTVALSGVGGDELFAGYPFFRRYVQLRKYSGMWNVTSLFRKLAISVMPDPKWKDLLELSSTDIAAVYPVLRQVVSDKEIRSVTKLNYLEDPVRALLESELLQISGFPLLSQISISEYIGYTRQTLLKDTDQMSMAVSLEVREPFFDHELIQYVLGISDQIKDPIYPKKLLVESLGDLLPPEIVHRKKQGFTFPWALWMKNELREFCELRIERICQRDFINGMELRKKWNGFLQGDKTIRWMEIWLFVILEYWLEKNDVS